MNRELGPTPWQEVTQSAIDTFAAVTDDHQWIHVDAARAAAGPLRGTIAHGLYTLSLGPGMLAQLLTFEGFGASLNYGYDRVRFPAPLPVGSRVRMSARVVSVTDVGEAIHVRNQQIFECQGQERPVAVADSIAHLLPLSIESDQVDS